MERDPEHQGSVGRRSWTFELQLGLSLCVPGAFFHCSSLSPPLPYLFLCLLPLSYNGHSSSHPQLRCCTCVGLVSFNAPTTESAVAEGEDILAAPTETTCLWDNGSVRCHFCLRMVDFVKIDHDLNRHLRQWNTIQHEKVNCRPRMGEICYCQVHLVTYTTIRISLLRLFVLRWEQSRPYQRQRVGEMCRFARVRPHLALCMNTTLYAVAPLR